MNNFQSMEIGGSNSVIQTLDFSSFKKKSNEHCLNFQKVDGQENEFKISKCNNSLLIILVINSFLILNEPKKLKNQKEKIFPGLELENVPKQFTIYQHPNTLEQLWTVIRQKAKNSQDLEYLLTSFPVVTFVLECYGRKMIKDYLDQTLDLDLMGNQDQILTNFSCQIRGNLLGYLATILKMDVTVVYIQKNEEIFRQSLGNCAESWKVTIHDDKDGFIFEVSEVEKSPKLLSISSSQNISYAPVNYSRKKLSNHNNYTESEISETTTEAKSYQRAHMDSKSANKDPIYRCRVCSSKVRFCECEQKKKGTTPKMGNNSNIIAKSLFDGLGFDRPAAMRRGRQDISVKMCNSCNRLACLCRK